MELEYFLVDDMYGWDQERFTDPLMKLGGCGAVTACDCCIYLSKYKGLKALCPFSTSLAISARQYKNFARVMKHYLHPRWQGIDTLTAYMEGFAHYIDDTGTRGVFLRGLDGAEPYAAAAAAVEKQIGAGLPVPCLTLNHQDKSFSDFEWHWYLLTGWRRSAEESAEGCGESSAEGRGEGRIEVKAVSYGEFVWLDFERLWDTGFEKKGGLVQFALT